MQIVALDLNGDGMSDVWQAKYGITLAMANDDPDGDGYSNAEEALAGTNPFDPTDFPKIASVTRAYNPTINRYEVTLSWRSIEGGYYLVEESDDVGINGWTPVLLPPSATPLGQSVGGVGTYSWVTFPLYPQSRKFYRITASATSMPINFATTIVAWEIQVWGSDPATTDSDNDGMPDAYEIINGLNPFFNDAGFLNGSGITNLQAYLISIGAQTLPATEYEGFLTHDATFRYEGVDSWSPFVPHYTFSGPLYFVDNFIKNPPPYRELNGNKYVVDEHQTEYLGYFERLYDHAIIDGNATQYATDFQTAAAEDETTRWAHSNGIADSVDWIQGNYPDQTFTMSLSDAKFAKKIHFLTAQLASVATVERTFVYPIIVADYPIGEDGVISVEPSTGNPSAPTVYTGSVVFTIPPGSLFPATCAINNGNLPTEVVETKYVTATNITRACALITVAPPLPNMRRTVGTVKFEKNQPAYGFDDTVEPQWQSIPVKSTAQGADYVRKVKFVPSPGIEGIFEFEAQPTGSVTLQADAQADGATVLSLEGNTVGEVALKAKVKGSGAVVREMKLDVLKRTTRNVDARQITLTAGAYPTVPSSIVIKTYLDSVWGVQANVWFNLQALDSKIVSYDQDGDGKLDVESTSFPVSALSYEERTIIARTATSAKAWIDSTAEIKMSYVVETTSAALGVTGYASPPGDFNNSAYWVFVGENAVQSRGVSILTVIGHELGHCLGNPYVAHNDSSNDNLMKNGFTGFASPNLNPKEVRHVDWKQIVRP